MAASRTRAYRSTERTLYDLGFAIIWWRRLVGMRVFTPPRTAPRLQSIDDVSSLLHRVIPNELAAPQESLHVTTLDAKERPTCVSQLSRGSVNMVLAPVREVLAVALLTGAKSVFCTHNHPSGSIVASGPDYNFAAGMREAFTELIRGVKIQQGILTRDVSRSNAFNGTVPLPSYSSPRQAPLGFLHQQLYMAVDENERPHFLRNSDESTAAFRALVPAPKADHTYALLATGHLELNAVIDIGSIKSVREADLAKREACKAAILTASTAIVFITEGPTSGTIRSLLASAPGSNRVLENISVSYVDTIPL